MKYVFCFTENLEFLGVFAKLRKETISFVMSLRPPDRVEQLVGRIFMKFDIWVFFEKIVAKIPVSLKLDKNNG